MAIEKIMSNGQKISLHNSIQGEKMLDFISINLHSRTGKYLGFVTVKNEDLIRLLKSSGAI